LAVPVVGATNLYIHIVGPLPALVPTGDPKEVAPYVTLDIFKVPLFDALMPTSIKRFVPDPVVKFVTVTVELVPVAVFIFPVSTAMAASDTEANSIVAAIKTPTIHPMLHL
jgi:hypothetical protein